MAPFYVLIGVVVVIAAWVAINSMTTMHGMGKVMEDGEKERAATWPWKVKSAQVGSLTFNRGATQLTATISAVNPLKSVIAVEPKYARFTLVDDSTIRVEVPARPYDQIVTWKLREYY